MAAVPSIGRASLVEASRLAPEAAATEELYERHGAKIQSYCLHQLGSREEAEDAVQTTFMNAFRALGRGIVPEAEAAWLYKIAENVCLSRHRSSWRRGRIESAIDFELIEEVVPAPSRQRDELIGLEDALASMPEQQRRAILLREWQGLSYREVADELDVSQSAVETLIFRARRSLAQGLEQPAATSRRRFRRALHALDIGPALAALKTLLAGGAAVKATAAAVAVTAAVGVAAGSTPAPAPGPTLASATKRAVPTPPATAPSSRATVGVASQSPIERAAPKSARPAKATAGKSARAARAPAERARVGQGRSARTLSAPVRDVAQGLSLGRGGNGPRAIAPPGRASERVPVQPRAAAAASEPPATAAGRSKAAAARDKYRPQALATLTPARRRSSAGRALHS